MSRHLDKVWLLLVVLAVGVTVACSSTSSTDDGGTQNTPEAATGG